MRPATISEYSHVDHHKHYCLHSIYSERCCPLKEVKLYCYGPMGTTELVLYREVKCIVECPLREVPLSFKTGSTVPRMFLLHM